MFGKLFARLDAVISELNEHEVNDHKKAGFTHPADIWTCKKRNKYVALDVGDSGAFLIEKETGEIFNINGYGQPDKNKKKKADIGNIYTVDSKVLHSKRWNYLR